MMIRSTSVYFYSRSYRVTHGTVTYILFFPRMATGQRAHTTDSGWAWVVLLASLGNHFLNGAECYCVGLVHVGLLQKFQPDTITFLALSGAVFSSLICIAGGCNNCCMCATVP